MHKIKIPATFSGFSAIILWSLSVTLTRALAESLGPFTAGAAIYAVSGIFVWLLLGKPQIKQQSRQYLWGCGSLFVIYMIAFALAIGLANNRQQALEIGLINYLWPSLTLLLAIPLQKIKVRWWLWPGIILAFAGVMMAMMGDQQMDFSGLVDNKIAYLLAFIAAVSWAVYSNLLRLYCNDKGALPLFLLITSACLYAMSFIFEQQTPIFTRSSITELLIMGSTTAVAYMCWDNAMKIGNTTFIAALSYLTPLFSMLIASVWLNTPLPLFFWFGLILVIIGSLFCWSASRNQNNH